MLSFLEVAVEAVKAVQIVTDEEVARKRGAQELSESHNIIEQIQGALLIGGGNESLRNGAARSLLGRGDLNSTLEAYAIFGSERKQAALRPQSQSASQQQALAEPKKRAELEQQVADAAELKRHKQLLAVLKGAEAPVWQAFEDLGKLNERIAKNYFFDEKNESSENVFSNLLNNPAIDFYSKRIFLKALLKEKGYAQYAAVLFNDPLLTKVDALLRSESQPLLMSIYHREVNQSKIAPQVERDLWQYFLNSYGKSDQKAVQTLYSGIKQEKRQLQFLVDWISSRNTATEVINAFLVIQEMAGSPDTKLSSNLSNFFKIAKQRILAIQIAQESHEHEGENNKEINNFLKTPRNGIASGIASGMRIGFFTHSLKVSHLIENKNFKEARELWMESEKALKEGFYKKNELSRYGHSARASIKNASQAPAR